MHLLGGAADFTDQFREIGFEQIEGFADAGERCGWSDVGVVARRHFGRERRGLFGDFGGTAFGLPKQAGKEGHLRNIL
jgi:hypothetical protein